MPTNVTPQYKEAEARFRAARTNEEKIAALEEMLAIMPKHKGTDKLQADVKARLAKLRREGGQKSGARGTSHLVPREGAGQVALVGPPNAGKSSLVARTTHAEPKVADYPFTTREAVPGMMHHEDVALQLVDLPAVSREHVEPWVFDLVRRADLVWVVVPHESAPEDFEEVRRILADKHLVLVPALDGSPPKPGEKRTLLVVTGMDRPGGAENLAVLGELLDSTWPIQAVSAKDGSGLLDLGARSFGLLGLIRVYTKEPGKPPDKSKPFTLPRGATVAELAGHIHREIAEGFRYARIWGSSAFDGQQVRGDHPLEDGDVVEIHMV